METKTVVVGLWQNRLRVKNKFLTMSETGCDAVLNYELACIHLRNMFSKCRSMLAE